MLPPGTTVKTNPDGSISVQGIVLDIPIGLQTRIYKSQETFTLIQIHMIPLGSGSPASLPAGTKVTKNPDGTISVGGQVLPPGTSVKTNPDGSISVQGIVLDIPNDIQYIEQNSTVLRNIYIVRTHLTIPFRISIPSLPSSWD